MEKILTGIKKINQTFLQFFSIYEIYESTFQETK